MSEVCILTDSTAVFTQPDFPGTENIAILPFTIQINGKAYTDNGDLLSYRDKLEKISANFVHTYAPSARDFYQAFLTLGQEYRSVIAILSSSQLFASCSHAQQAAESAKNTVSIDVIDSQSFGTGLGFLIQAAIDAVQNGADTTQIKSIILGLIPHTYAMLCLQSLAYLANAGYLEPAQAVVGEILGLVPLFVMENGNLVPTQKARSTRHLVDILHEFISEFFQLKQISILQGFQPYEQEVRNLRDRLNQTLPTPLVSEHIFNPTLAATFGPRSLSVFALEQPV
jgi:DegV family protein with EDD domain